MYENRFLKELQTLIGEVGGGRRREEEKEEEEEEECSRWL